MMKHAIYVDFFLYVHNSKKLFTGWRGFDRRVTWANCEESCFFLFRYVLSMAFNCKLLVCSVNSDASSTICSSIFFFVNVYEFSSLISLVWLHRKRIVSSQLLELNRKSIHFYDEKLFIRRIIARILKMQSKINYC